MSNEQDPSVEDAQRPIGNSPTAGFDAEALHNLVGFFDVLIQMDLEQKSKERQRDESIRSQRHAD